MPAPKLAIIIPAFKVRFLEQTLQSLAAQSSQQFTLYVFDDASPESVEEVVKKFQTVLPLTYHRFVENLGGRSLPQHWDRCIARTVEPWIWLFSDDDEMEPTCVEAFWRELEATNGGFDLYRFNTRCIDKESKIIAVNDPYPVEEWGKDFLLVRLLEQRGSTAQELIFSRQKWEEIGRFPDYPLAWAADDAFIAMMGKEKPIRLISGPRIRWRLSGSNITSLNSVSIFSKKIAASRMFIQWVKRFLTEEKLGEKKFTGKEIDAMAEMWFFRWLFYMRNRLGWQTCSEVDAFISEMWGYPRGYGWSKCLIWNCRMILAAIWRRLCAL